MPSHVGYAAPTWQHELDPTDQRNLSALEDLDHEVGTDHTDHLSEVWKFFGGRKGLKATKANDFDGNNCTRAQYRDFVLVCP